MVIFNAFTITPEGELEVLEEWNGHRGLKFSEALSSQFQEQDVPDFICVASGMILGLLEDFLST